MYLIFEILDNLYRAEMLIQVFLGNFIHWTLKQCLKVAGIGQDNINAYLAELINDGANKVAYLQWRRVQFLLLFLAKRRDEWLLLLANHVRGHDTLLLGSIICKIIILDSNSVKIAEIVNRAGLDNLCKARFEQNW